VKKGLLARVAAGAAATALLAACGSTAGTPGPSATAPARPSASGAAHTPSPATRTPAQPGPAPARTTPAPARTSPAPARTTGVPPAAVPARLAGRDWTIIPTSRTVVALTFDAGANDAGLPSILATLRRTGVPATFFLTGDFVRAFPASARAIAAGGYRIGDHTVSHPHLTTLSDAAVRAQILTAARQIRAATGADPAPLFRFPFGDADQRTIAVANRAGYVPVRWTVDTLGWEGRAGGSSAAAVRSRVLAALQPGEIVLMHIGSNPDDGTTFDADALPQLISQLRARGYSFVTLAALVG
jgi:peptidoglycan/xylan/chitin deacetylase (PgdA/CDA1 family)